MVLLLKAVLPRLRGNKECRDSLDRMIIEFDRLLPEVRDVIKASTKNLIYEKPEELEKYETKKILYLVTFFTDLLIASYEEQKKIGFETWNSKEMVIIDIMIHQMIRIKRTIFNLLKHYRY